MEEIQCHLAGPPCGYTGVTVGNGFNSAKECDEETSGQRQTHTFVCEGCKLKLSAEITAWARILDPNDPLWAEKGKTYSNTIKHEKLHVKTWSDFANSARAGLTQIENRFSGKSPEDCKKGLAYAEERFIANFGLAASHSFEWDLDALVDRYGSYNQRPGPNYSW